LLHDFDLNMSVAVQASKRHISFYTRKVVWTTYCVRVPGLRECAECKDKASNIAQESPLMNEHNEVARMRNIVDSIVGTVHRCKECGSVLSILPTTWVCLNEECSQAGVLAPRKVNRKTGRRLAVRWS
jgi:hypothetical protein